jgi:hypothetical protein
MSDPNADGDKPGDLLEAAERMQKKRRKANELTKGTDKREFTPRT